MSPKDITHDDYLKLINSIFTTDEGKLLIEVWTNQFLFKKIANYGDDLLDIGIRQGEAGFVLSIHNLLEQIKKGEQ